jgi:hypothetical protein
MVKQKAKISFLVLVSLLSVLSFVAGPLGAAPIVNFEPALSNQTNLSNLDTFGLNTNPAGNFGPAAFHNGTGLTFVDFHFSFPAQPLPAGGNGGPFFGGVSGTTTTLDFTLDGGTGMPTSTNFTITATGFTPNTRIAATPTVPEPSTVLLLGSGIAVLARYCWRRR